jgi:hypothetical protein
LDDEETLQGSTAPSGVPSLNQVNAAVVAISDATSEKRTVLTIDLSTPDSETSDSDAMATDNKDERLSLAELTQAAKHVQKLLKCIMVFQQGLESNKPSQVHKNRLVNKIYQRFCRKWEESVVVESNTAPVAYAGMSPTQLHRKNRACRACISCSRQKIAVKEL